MGTVRAEITIKNSADVVKALEGLIREDEIRSISVTAMVDTGAGTLVINEQQSEELGLCAYREGTALLADGRRIVCKITRPVQIQWKDRETSCETVVIPEAKTVLLGAIPLEGMDIMINPKKEELVGIHGDEAEIMLL